jgi:hypothetical protein
MKGEDYTITFKKEGCTPHTAEIERGVDGWYLFGNFFIGWLVGWVVIDPATGAMWTLKDLEANLVHKSSTSQNQVIHIVTLDEVPEHIRSKLLNLN